MEQLTIGFIGGGRIVQALLDGLNEGHHLAQMRVIVSCPSANHENSPLRRYKNLIETTTSNIDVCRRADIIILAVKAKLLKSICEDIVKTSVIDDRRSSNILFVSVIPGLKLSTISSWIIPHVCIIRIMYNVNVAKSNGAYAISSSIENERLRLLEVHLRTVFDKVAYYAGNVSESELDIVCALIGSGPAFCCTAVEGLADGAVKAGLSRPLANRLAALTMFGCGNTLVSSSKLPAELKNDISTPGGTTIYGLHELENKGVRGAYMDAIMAAYNRAQDMADELDRKYR